MSDTLVQSVRKAMNILDILVFEDLERNGIGLFDLAKKMDLKPNTLHNLLKTMISCGYVEQNQDSKYLAGPKCRTIGIINSMAGNDAVAELAEPMIRELSHLLDEAVVFAVLANGNRIPVIRIDHDHPIKIDFSSIENEHIYDKETGRVLTAFADEYNFSLIKKNWGYPGEMWNNINSDSAFKETLEKVRKKGYLIGFTQRGEIVSAAVPVFDASGKLAGSIGCYAPLYRCNEEKQKVIVKELKTTAEQIRREIWGVTKT